MNNENHMHLMIRRTIYTVQDEELNALLQEKIWERKVIFTLFSTLDSVHEESENFTHLKPSSYLIGTVHLYTQLSFKGSVHTIKKTSFTVMLDCYACVFCTSNKWALGEGLQVLISRGCREASLRSTEGSSQLPKWPTARHSWAPNPGWWYIEKSMF